MAARAADDKHARDVRLLDVRRSSSVTDFLVVATVDSAPQMQAVEDEISRRVNEELSLTPLRRDGRFKATWRVLDFGGCVVHLFTEASRAFYDLERLWELAKPVEWAASKTARPGAEPRDGRRAQRASNPARPAAEPRDGRRAQRASNPARRRPKGLPKK